MAKSKAKRPVGRPKKPKTAVKKNEGVFPLNYGTLHSPGYLNNADSEQFFDYANEKLPPRFLAYILSIQSQVEAVEKNLSLDHTVSASIREELKECLKQLDFLRKYVASTVEWMSIDDERDKALLDPGGDKLTIMRLMGWSFTAGQLSIVAPRRFDEPKYATGVKVKTGSEIGARQRRKSRPAKGAIERALRSEMKKHGKKTLAVNNAATAFDVSKNTLRTWIRELSITF